MSGRTTRSSKRHASRKGRTDDIEDRLQDLDQTREDRAEVEMARRLAEAEAEERGPISSQRIGSASGLDLDRQSTE
jgi:hypothetical protein